MLLKDAFNESKKIGVGTYLCFDRRTYIVAGAGAQRALLVDIGTGCSWERRFGIANCNDICKCELEEVLGDASVLGNKFDTAQVLTKDDALCAACKGTTPSGPLLKDCFGGVKVGKGTWLEYVGDIYLIAVVEHHSVQIISAFGDCHYGHPVKVKNVSDITPRECGCFPYDVRDGAKIITPKEAFTRLLEKVS